MCRFELQTSDKVFEEEKRAGGTARKARYKRKELKNMKVKELRAILVANDIDGTGFAEKGEIVDAICSSEKVRGKSGSVVVDDMRKKRKVEVSSWII